MDSECVSKFDFPEVARDCHGGEAEAQSGHEFNTASIAIALNFATATLHWLIE